MCGVVGYIELKGREASPAVLKEMTDAIAHRGPDGEGHWIEGNVGIGHRRLSIIDPSDAGHQPMVSSDGRYVLSYNGELYNFRELRSELEDKGFSFVSQTDSEVVLYSLISWGESAFLRFNGMFAVALWDRQERSLLLARDRYGIKPLYYSKQKGRFAFASEHKAITVMQGFEKTVNKPALLEYFTFQNIFSDQTFLEDISLVPAGHWLKLYVQSETTKLHQYWDFHFRKPEDKRTVAECAEELSRLFEQAVRRQLVSDVEIGTYLSGGMDSASIAAVASRSMPNLKSFTCGFDLSSASGIELAYDERQKAEAMSALLKTEHYEMVLKAGDMERCLGKLVWHLEEPRVGQSYPNYYASSLASRFVKVVLSGAGGDEIFAGYPWRYYRAARKTNFKDYVDEYYLYWQRLASNTELRGMFRPIWSDVKEVWTRDIFEDVFISHENDLANPEDFINHSLYFEAKTFLHGLLVVEDKVSMSHGLETRVPFLDNDLVEFAMTCPTHMKLNNLSEVMRVNENDIASKHKSLFQKTNDGKQILRHAMKNFLPGEVLSAEKQGFSSPDASWFKGESIDFVRQKLLTPTARIYDFFDPKYVSRLIGSHLDGGQNRRLLIWSLLNFEAWLEAYT